jgi:hypothetical protein
MQPQMSLRLGKIIVGQGEMIEADRDITVRCENIGGGIRLIKSVSGPAASTPRSGVDVI